METPNGQPLPVNAVELLTRASLPEVTDKFDVPVASAAGKSAPTVGLEGPSFTRKYLPGAMEQLPDGHSAVTDQLVPVADACCADQPAISTVVVPRLNSSMKSFLKVAPELLPPP